MRAQLLIRLGPFELSTRHHYISWGRWGLWVHPFGRYRRAGVTVTHFGPGSQTWLFFPRGAP